MGKNSEFNKQKDHDYRVKLESMKKELPVYTHEFLDSKASRNPSTAVAYAYDFRIFFNYLKEFGTAFKDTPIKDIPAEYLENLTYKDINEYLRYLSAKDITVTGSANLQNNENGIARRLSTLRSFFQYQCDRHEFEHNPTSGANTTRIQDDSHVIIRMTQDEVDDFLETIRKGDIGSSRQQKLLKKSQYRDYAILTLLLRTGIRVSECVSLDLADLNFKENSMLVVRKGGKEHILYFDEKVRDALQDYITLERPHFVESDKEPALFMSFRKQRLAVRSVQEMVKKYAVVAVPNKKITPHKMRSTYGTALYNATGDIRLVADVLGHSDINTTAKHYAANEDEHRKMAAKIDPYSK